MGWMANDEKGVMSYACGYRRGSKVRKGDEFTVLNGSRIAVMKTHPITGFFYVKSINMLGMTQFLWYDRDGHCLGPNADKDWGGDDFHMPEHLVDRESDQECGRAPSGVHPDDCCRWDEI